MTAEQTARRLDSAAEELACVKAELAAAMEFGLDASGPGAGEVLGKLSMVWSRHTELAGRLSAEVSGLSAAVLAATTAYREADESSSVRLSSEGGAAGTSGAADVSWGGSGSGGGAGVWGAVDVSVTGSAEEAAGGVGEVVGVAGEVAASWGVAGLGGASSGGGFSGDVKEGR